MAVTSLVAEVAAIVFGWPTVAFMLFGLVVGIFFGALPGVGALVALALALPLTFGMPPQDGIVLLIAIYVGGMYGSCIAAILINTPGSPAAAATALDGYPMTQQGRAKEALTLSAISSSFGGIAAAVFVLLLIPILVPTLRLFQSPELALVAAIGIAMIAYVSKGSIAKGLIAGVMGILLSTIGFARGVHRFTFDQFFLIDGVHFVPALLGIFAFAEMIRLSEKSAVAAEDVPIEGSQWESAKLWYRYKLHSLKSALIGMGAGMVPGAGAAIGNFLAYGEATRAYGKDGHFGEGDERGVIASESADNGSVAGSIVPTVAFGVPGSASTAILLGALIFHGLQPGPGLFNENLALVIAMYVVVVVGNVIILFIGLGVATKANLFTRIDPKMFIPIVIVLCVVGTIILRTNWFDLLVFGAFGLAGLLMVKHGYSLVAFVLGIVLGPIMEKYVIRALEVSGGSPAIFVSDPLSIGLTLLLVVTLLAPVAKDLARRAEGD